MNRYVFCIFSFTMPEQLTACPEQIRFGAACLQSDYDRPREEGKGGPEGDSKVGGARTPEGWRRSPPHQARG